MKKANSHKQSGGVTANKVTIGGDFHNHSPKPKSKKRLATIVAIFTIIGVIIAALTYFNITPSNMTDQQGSSQHAESNKQSGGINANVVNINGPSDNEFEKYYTEVSSLENRDGLYRRSVIVRNNTKTPQTNVHISIQGTKDIKALGPPWPEGGGMIGVQYQKTEGATYETEIATIPANKFVKIILASSEPFELEVKVY